MATMPPVSLLSDRRPFPGLRPFAYEDHDYFFGRQKQVFALYRLIDRSRFVAVVGSSGSGKSSLVRAGLLPLLDKEKQRTGERVWRRLDLLPGSAPLEALATALAELADDTDETIAATRRQRIAFELRQGSIGQALAEAGGVGASKLLLLVDQFEELFRFVGARRDLAQAALTRGDAVRFVQLLIEASRLAGTSITVVLTMRSDFIGECALFQGLPEVVSANQYLVPALTRDQREEIIRKPVAKAGATIEPILVERLLNDSGSDLDQLPVLQHCLLRIWQEAGKRSTETGDGGPDRAEAPRLLIENDYGAVGGMRKAMSQHADEICNALPAKDREIERVFRALSELRDNKAIRRVASLETLCAETGSEEQTLRDVLDAFRDDGCSFLRPSLSVVASLSSATLIDVGHEALLRRWEKLTGDAEATGEANDQRPIGWLRQERRDARRYESLLSIVEGAKSGEAVLDPSLTPDYADWWAKLAPTSAWADRYGDRFDSVKELIERSVRHVDELRRQAEAHDRYIEGQKRAAEEQERQEADRRRRWQWIRAGLLALSIVVIFAFVLGFRQYQANSDQKLAAQISALNSARAYVSQIEKTVTAGDLPVKVARDLLTISDQIIDDVSKNASTLGARRLNIELIVAKFDVFYILGDIEKCLELGKLAEGEANILIKADPSEGLPLYEAKFRLGDLAARANNGRRALEYYEDAFKAASSVPESAVQQRKLLVAHNKIGETYLMLKAWPEAIRSLHAALDIEAAYIAKEPSVADWKRQRAATLVKLGLVLAKQPSADRDATFTAAMAAFNEAIAVQKKLLITTPADVTVQSNLATSYIRKANVLVDFGKFAEAFPNIQLAIEIHQPLADRDSDNAIWLDYLARDFAYYGDALDKFGDTEGALDYYNKAATLREKAIAKNPKRKSYQKNLAEIKKRVEELKTKLGTDEALPPRR